MGFAISAAICLLMLLPLTSANCPVQCTCTPLKAKDTTGVRVRCSPQGSNYVTALTDINKEEMPKDVIYLDLSGNALEKLEKDAFAFLPDLQKLVLANNKISDLAIGSFNNLTHLKNLDLSSNQLSHLPDRLWMGLDHLQKLRLSRNQLTRLSERTFRDLPSLQFLELGSNRLICDCRLRWLLDEGGGANRTSLTVKGQCHTPTEMSGTPLKRVPSLSLQCDSLHSQTSRLALSPSASQVVFAGDSLHLKCHFTVYEADVVKLDWVWRGEVVPAEAPNVAEDGSIIERSLLIEKLQTEHSGEWTCRVITPEFNQNRSVSVFVLSENTTYCSNAITTGSKGTYLWPKTVAGITVQLPCELSPAQRGPATASHKCGADGIWESPVTEDCAYARETTRLLEQMTKMNLTALGNAVLLATARQLRNLTISLQLVDEMDVVFISNAVYSFAEHLPQQKLLGPLLVDVISQLMQVDVNLLAKAQSVDGACTRLVDSLEAVVTRVPSFQYHKSHMALEGMMVRAEGYTGITCTWYTAMRTGARTFRCATTNKTSSFGGNDMQVEASIQLPTSLFRQLDLQHMNVRNDEPVTSTDFPVHDDNDTVIIEDNVESRRFQRSTPVSPPSSHQLLFATFTRSELFPQLQRDENVDRMAGAPVIGAKLAEEDVSGLLEPVYVTLRTPGDPSYAIPAWWDSTAANGRGAWVRGACRLARVVDSLLMFSCDRLGYYTLVEQSDRDDNIVGPDRQPFRPSHPAIYVGCSLCLSGLLPSILVYVLLYPSVGLSRRLKHALANCWLAATLLCFLFTLGVYQTENVLLCKIIGLVLHYLTLSTLLWLLVAVSSIHRKLSRATADTTASVIEEDDWGGDMGGPHVRQPMLQHYLVGWGIGLIVCGISAAVHLPDYAGTSYCFLSPSLCVGAVLVPSSTIVFLIVVFFLLGCCIARSTTADNGGASSSQALIPAQPRPPSPSLSTCSSIDIDQEKTVWHTLRVLQVFLLLFLLAWGSGALATAGLPDGWISFDASIVEHVAASIFAVTAAALGMLVVSCFCLGREDVRNHVKKIYSKQLPEEGDTESALQAHASNNNDEDVECNEHTIATTLPEAEHVAPPSDETATSESKPTVNKTEDDRSSVLPPPPLECAQSVKTVPLAPPVCGFYNPYQSGVAKRFFERQRLKNKGDAGNIVESIINRTKIIVTDDEEPSKPPTPKKDLLPLPCPAVLDVEEESCTPTCAWSLASEPWGGRAPPSSLVSAGDCSSCCCRQQHRANRHRRPRSGRKTSSPTRKVGSADECPDCRALLSHGTLDTASNSRRAGRSKRRRRSSPSVATKTVSLAKNHISKRAQSDAETALNKKETRV